MDIFSDIEESPDKEKQQEPKEKEGEAKKCLDLSELFDFAPDIDMTANQSDSDREEEEQEKKASTEMNRRIQEQERRKKAQQFIFQKQLQEKRDEYDLYVDLWSVICVVMIWAWTIPYVSLVCADSLGWRSTNQGHEFQLEEKEDRGGGIRMFVFYFVLFLRVIHLVVHKDECCNAQGVIPQIHICSVWKRFFWASDALLYCLFALYHCHDSSTLNWKGILFDWSIFPQ